MRRATAPRRSDRGPSVPRQGAAAAAPLIVLDILEEGRESLALTLQVVTDLDGPVLKGLRAAIVEIWMSESPLEVRTFFWPFGLAEISASWPAMVPSWA